MLGLVLLLVIYLIGVIIGISLEKKVWNNGICKESGKPWIYFDLCFAGDRLYTDNHDNYCSVSYNSVDK